MLGPRSGEWSEQGVKAWAFGARREGLDRTALACRNHVDSRGIDSSLFDSFNQTSRPHQNRSQHLRYERRRPLSVTIGGVAAFNMRHNMRESDDFLKRLISRPKLCIRFHPRSGLCQMIGTPTHSDPSTLAEHIQTWRPPWLATCTLSSSRPV